jgi:hypothetical protein
MFSIFQQKKIWVKWAAINQQTQETHVFDTAVEAVRYTSTEEGEWSLSSLEVSNS